MVNNAILFVSLFYDVVGVNIPIKDGSFEIKFSPIPSNTFYYPSHDGPLNWTWYNPNFCMALWSASYFNPTGGTTYHDPRFNDSVPTGVVALDLEPNESYYTFPFGEGAGEFGVEQTLTGQLVTALTRYTLSAYVGNPNNNQFSDLSTEPNFETTNRAGFPGYKLVLMTDDDTILAQDEDSVSPADGEWAFISTQATIYTVDTNINKTLKIRLVNKNSAANTGYEVDFDDIQLIGEVITAHPTTSRPTFTPTQMPTKKPTTQSPTSPSTFMCGRSYTAAYTGSPVSLVVGLSFFGDLTFDTTLSSFTVIGITAFTPLGGTFADSDADGMITLLDIAPGNYSFLISGTDGGSVSSILRVVTHCTSSSPTQAPTNNPTIAPSSAPSINPSQEHNANEATQSTPTMDEYESTLEPEASLNRKEGMLLMIFIYTVVGLGIISIFVCVYFGCYWFKHKQTVHGDDKIPMNVKPVQDPLETNQVQLENMNSVSISDVAVQNVRESSELEVIENGTARKDNEVELEEGEFEVIGDEEYDTNMNTQK
eukprot:63898_1